MSRTTQSDLAEESKARQDPGSPQYSARYAWYVIGLLTVVNAFNYIDRMALSVLLPSIKADFALTDAQAGLLIGFAFSIFYAICGIPIARWADRGIRRNIIALAVAVWSAMTALSGASQNFWQMFVARIGVGAGEAGGVAPGSSLLCDYVPLKRRAGAFSIYNFGIVGGTTLGLMLTGWLGEALGWRLTFLALGLPGLGLALLVRLTLREPHRGYYDSEDAGSTDLPFGQALAVLWHRKTYRLLLFFFVMNAFLQFGLGQWWPTFYTRLYGLPMSSVGAYLGLALGVGSGIGTLIGGALANRASQRDVGLPLIVGAVAVSLALPAALASLFATSAVVSMLLVSVATLFWSMPVGPLVATILSAISPRMRATGAAATTLAYSVLGYGLGPFLVGWLSDTLSPVLEQESLRYALLAPIMLIPPMVIVLLVAAKSLHGDVRAKA